MNDKTQTVRKVLTTKVSICFILKHGLTLGVSAGLLAGLGLVPWVCFLAGWVFFPILRWLYSVDQKEKIVSQEKDGE